MVLVGLVDWVSTRASAEGEVLSDIVVGLGMSEDVIWLEEKGVRVRDIFIDSVSCVYNARTVNGG